MSSYMDAYLDFMDEAGIKYVELDDNLVRVSYSGKNMKSIRIFVSFDPDGQNYVQFFCSEIGSYRGERIASGLIICNAMNARYRWVKFYLDQENDAICESDALVDMDNVGQTCSEIVGRMVSIIDEAYPEFMKALWA